MASTLIIRPFEDKDETAVIGLWHEAGVSRPWNDPKADIERKRKVQPELFLVGELSGQVVASAMAGYDGHRGWVYYLAVLPSVQRRGYARALMREVERLLIALGCPKLNLQVRTDNQAVIDFYHRIGYATDRVSGLGRRLIPD